MVNIDGLLSALGGDNALKRCPEKLAELLVTFVSAVSSLPAQTRVVDHFIKEVLATSRVPSPYDLANINIFVDPDVTNDAIDIIVRPSNLHWSWSWNFSGILPS